MTYDKQAIAERIRDLSPEKSELLDKLLKEEEGEHLASLLRQETDSDEWSPLVAIQSAGLKPPFFCVSPVFGTVFIYHDLAYHLGKDQPFYGLQPFGVDRAHLPDSRIEDMAARYVDALRSLQPEGPYFLGGYSFGGVVAFEMAQQLQNKGHQVALLALIDTWVPISVSKPSLLDTLKFLATSTVGIWPYVCNYLSLVASSSLPQGNHITEKFPILKTVFPRFYINRLLDAIVRKLGMAKILFSESGLMMFNQPAIRPMLRVLKASIQAFRNYTPRTYSGPITCFQTGGTYTKGDQYATIGWSKLTTGGIDIHSVPGDHLAVMRKPHVQVLAEELRACLDKSLCRIQKDKICQPAIENKETKGLERRKKSRDLDSQTQALLQKIAKEEAFPLETLTPMQARKAEEGMRAFAGELQPIANVEDKTILHSAGEIPVRIYTPEGCGPFPILVYLHGGGWVVGNLDIYNDICRSLANGAGCIVVSVDYRLAPEHKFPAAVEDAYTATQWIANNASCIGGDPTRITVGGDSAGGNLAAVVSIIAHERGGPPLVYQLLIYPATNLSSFDTNSYHDYAEGYFLTKASMQWFRNHYLKNDDDRRNPYASPLLSKDLSGLPPAFVITAGFDVLKDEGEAYANRLKRAGVSVRHVCYNDTIHGFFFMAGVLDKARTARGEATAALRVAFAK